MKGEIILTPDLLCEWSLSILVSGIAICLLALGIRGTIKIFVSKEEKQEAQEAYAPGHPKPPKVPPPPPIPPANYSPPPKPPKQP